MNQLNFSSDDPKATVFERTHEYLKELDISISDTDDQRPWGGFFVIDAVSTDLFIDTYFPEFDKTAIYKYGTEVSPKILLVAPEQKLSWQYHHRRAELWKAVLGPVAVYESATDEIPANPRILETGEAVQHDDLARHRLGGLANWGVVAEIWQHTVEGEPSDEDDIVRLEDNYGRN